MAEPPSANVGPYITKRPSPSSEGRPVHLFSGPLSGVILVDRIIVYKNKRILILFYEGRPIRFYRVALGRHPVGPKKQEGDMRTPEGEYIIDFKNPNSIYYKALHISYPNEEDVRRAKKLNVSPGGGIEIHGLKQEVALMGPTHSFYDWTRGCIALSDEEMDEIWKLVPVGTPIEIRP
jgi:murein L,D-transpeptidase YafK